VLQLSDVVSCLALLVGCLLLDKLQVLLEALLLITQLLLIVLHSQVVAFLGALALLEETALVAILLDLVEALELV
jgi:hypothetical protein